MTGKPATALKAGTVRQASGGSAGGGDLAEVYAQMLAAVGRSSKAREYLSSRRLEELTDVGYNPGTLYKAVRQCVVFALRHEAHAVVSLYGRSVVAGMKSRHVYSPN